MGIRTLWEVLGDGEVWHIADYAAHHFQRYKRPLRIAVDSACWRFTNLNDEQVELIQKREPAANPIERTILFRILRLMKLNVQLIFIEDGNRRPWKRGKRGGNRVDFKRFQLTHKLLDRLGVPHHLAPGEAEAECARMQALGIVDAVWSDDGDSFMFGCGTLIRQHRDGKKALEGQVRIYQAEDIQQKFDLDAHSFVLVALLAGGDYNVEGLRGCGLQTAKLIATRSNGLARDICHASQGDLPAWRQKLQETMMSLSSKFNVPPTFPDWKALVHCRSPTISTDEKLHNLRGLRRGWDRPIDEAKLRVFLRNHFNFSTPRYIEHIVPIYLSRALVRAGSDQRDGNLALGIQFLRTRKKKNEREDTPARSERRIKFSPLRLTAINLSQRPLEEDWTKLAAKDGTPYDPTQNVECEILECFLRNGLPDGEFDRPSQSKTRPRRKRNAEEIDGSPESSLPADQQGRPSKSAKGSNNTPTDATISSESASNNGFDKSTTKQRQRQSGLGSNTARDKASKKNSTKGDSGLQPVSTNSASTTSMGAPVVDLCSDDSDEADTNTKTSPSPIGDQRPCSMLPSGPGSDTSDLRTSAARESLVPGQTIPAEFLRGLRTGSTIFATPFVSDESFAKPGVPSSPDAMAVEVIDLT